MPKKRGAGEADGIGFLAEAAGGRPSMAISAQTIPNRFIYGPPLANRLSDLLIVLAELRRSARQRRALSVEAEREREEVEVEPGDVLDDPARRRLGLGEHLGQRVDRRARHTGLLESVSALRWRALFYHALDLV